MLTKQCILTTVALSTIITPKTLSSPLPKDSTLGLALWHAVFQCDIEGVCALISMEAPINQTYIGGDTALIQAVTLRHNSIVKILLRANADINHANTWGETALTVAICQGHKETVKILLRAGAKTLSQPEIASLKRQSGIHPLLIQHMQDEISKERRESLGQWCEYIDEEYDVPPVIQQLIVRDMLGTVPEQMPAL